MLRSTAASPPTTLPQDLAGQALGLAISAAVPHEKIAMAIAPLVRACWEAVCRWMAWSRSDGASSCVGAKLWAQQ